MNYRTFLLGFVFIPLGLSYLILLLGLKLLKVKHSWITKVALVPISYILMGTLYVVLLPIFGSKLDTIHIIFWPFSVYFALGRH